MAYEQQIEIRVRWVLLLLLFPQTNRLSYSKPWILLDNPRSLQSVVVHLRVLSLQLSQLGDNGKSLDRRPLSVHTRIRIPTSRAAHPAQKCTS